MDFEAAHKKFKEDLERIDNMILMVLKNQIIVERFMIALLEAHGKDPKRFFFTSAKIEGCSDIDPPEVGKANWDLLTLCSYVRNELAHSLDNEKLKNAVDAVRNAYLAVIDNEAQKKSIPRHERYAPGDERTVSLRKPHCNRHGKQDRGRQERESLVSQD